MSDESFPARAMMRAAYDRAPVEDADRSDSEEMVGREVLAELPAPWPRDARTDDSVKLPLRVVVSTEGVELEIGPYDFDAVSVHMLKQAIACYELHGGETFPLKYVVRGNGEAAE